VLAAHSSSCTFVNHRASNQPSLSIIIRHRSGISIPYTSDFLLLVLNYPCYQKFNEVLVNRFHMDGSQVLIVNFDCL